MVLVETFVNLHQCIQTVLAARARLLPLQRQCQVGKKLKQEQNKRAEIT